MKKRNPNAHALLIGQPWAIQKGVLEAALNLVDGSIKDFQAASVAYAETSDQKGSGLNVIDGVAVVDMIGPVTRYATCLTAMNGWSTIDDLMAAMDLAEADSSVRAILLNVNSPGGSVDGTSELAQKVAALATKKPVVTYVGGMAASAAYWVAAQSTRIVSADTSALGSIGVYAAMDDNTKAMQAAGVDRYTIVSSQSPNKVPNPSTAEGRSQIQAHVDGLADIFIKAVASGRGVRVQTVMDQFGQGAVFLGAEAVRRKMADKVGVFEDALAEARTLGTMGPLQRAPLAQETEAVVAEEKTNKEGVKMTLEQLKAEHPDVYQAAKAEGVSDERTRLLALDDLSAVGYEEVVRNAKSSGMTVEQAAYAVLKAQKDKVGQIQANREKDAGKIPAIDPKTETEEETEDQKANALVAGIAAGFRKPKEVK